MGKSHRFEKVILFFSDNPTGTVLKEICLCNKQSLTVQQGGLNRILSLPHKSYNSNI